MQLFLGIISTVGFIILVILAIIIILIGLILFLPVVYRAKIKKQKDLEGDLSVRWLFGAVYFRLIYQKKEVSWALRIFGIPVLKSSKEKKIEKKESDQKAKKQPTIKPGEAVKEARQSDKEPVFEEGEVESGGKIPFTISSLCDKLEKIKKVWGVLKEVKPLLLKILKHIAPRKVDGYLAFGFEAPSQTGMLLGLLGALCIPIPKGLRIEPDFQEKKLECDLKIKGRIEIIVLLVNGCRLLKNKKIRKLLGLKKKGQKKAGNKKAAKKKANRKKEAGNG